jgi:ADP-dependent NAD(P)H-hydrate dehydratase / NAD(P)H-hydrate epimerase
VLPVLTAAEMRDADRRTIEEIGLPGAVLMENAGSAVARVIEERFPAARRPFILCGKGNNGGDGFVAARRLMARHPVTVLLGSRADVRGDALLHLGVLERSGGQVQETPDAASWASTFGHAAESDVIVDALLGTGLRQEPTGLAARAIADVAAWSRARGTPVVAVDVPSGLPSDSGEVGWPTVEAAVTVTFAAAKYGHVLPPACDRVGELLVADIGIPASALHPRLWLLEPADVWAVYPPRPASAHKGTFGHVLVVAGSIGKTGAAVLSAGAALVAGAGLVTVATAEPAVPLVAQARAELMTEALPVSASGGLDREAVARALALAKERDAVVLGPGLGQHHSTQEFVREFVRRCPSPMVVDADGLNALAGGRERPERIRREAPTVLTPHPGEMARLSGASTQEVQRRRLEAARALSLETGAVVVLKGQRTIVANPDGRAAVNPTGNPGLATGGTGDVLAGIVGALLARGSEPWPAACAAVHLHGSAGDRARERRGEESLLAGDLLDAIPEVLPRGGSRHS